MTSLDPNRDDDDEDESTDITPLAALEDEPVELTRRSGVPTSVVVQSVSVVVVEGESSGRRCDARHSVVSIGSAPDNDLVLKEADVSRRHCELRLGPSGIHLVDLGSTNGTYVAGLRLFDAIVPPGTLVHVGGATVRIETKAAQVSVPLSSATRFGRLIGASVAMRAVYAVLERVAPTSATVLLEGETGTGKELAAEAIHGASPRAEQRFVTVDCGAIAPTLIESELFGHKRGAFTGAVSDRRGAFEEADGGTLFLDEIGELPLELQPKLLRALDKREVRRVGETQPRAFDVRVIAATNRDLRGEVNRGAFREDLFFRLAVVGVRLPPLRARPEDISFLVAHFVERFAPGAVLPPELMAEITARSYPGNVRELRNVVERVFALWAAEHAQAAPSSERVAGSSLKKSVETEAERLLASPMKESLERWKELFERAYVEAALARSGGSVSAAARSAGVSRRYVQRLMQQYGLRDPEM